MMPDGRYEALFEPLNVRSLHLTNRIVMAPMTRSAARDGVPSSASAEYYGRRAMHGVGLILTEGVGIDRSAARNDPGVPLISGAAAAGGWSRVVDRVHAAGGKIAPQLWHVGASPNPASDWLDPSEAESPSGLAAPGVRRGRVMTDEDVADAIASFGRAAEAAARLGFDAVELHAAHGYLIDQFFWGETNRREDGYGGREIADRARFAAEVVRVVRRALPADLPISIRISQWKMQDYDARVASNPSEIVDWVGPLVEAGADIVHCSERRIDEPAFPEVDGPAGLNLAGWVKKLTGAVTIGVGSVGLGSDAPSTFAGQTSQVASLDRLVERMCMGEFDLVAVGRALLADPEWVEKVRDGRTDELRPFTPEALGVLF